MKEQIFFQSLIISKYEEIKAKNPSFSRRAFAKKIGLSPGAMSELFNGKRRVSAELAARIAERLLLDAKQKVRLIEEFSILKDIIEPSLDFDNVDGKSEKGLVELNGIATLQIYIDLENLSGDTTIFHHLQNEIFARFGEIHQLRDFEIIVQLFKKTKVKTPS